MSQCVFAAVDGQPGEYRCSACGAVVRGIAALPIHRQCDVAAPDEPQPHPQPPIQGTPLALLCSLESIPDTNDCRCTRCGQVFQDAKPDELRVRCAHEGLGQPPRVRRLFNFGRALGRHAIDVTAKLAQGRLSEAYRTPEEIDAIYEQHCKPCPLFNGQVCTHSNCGCNLGTHEKFLNKLKWRSERCPDHPPRWT